MKNTIGLYLVFLGCVLGCLGEEIDWGTLNCTTLHELDATEFENVTLADVGAIPPGSCCGFTEDQFNAIPVQSLNNFTVDCIGAIEPEVLAKINVTSFFLLPCEAFVPAQVPVFSEGQCAILNSSCISQFNAASYASLAPACVAKMEVAAFSAITPDQFAFSTKELCGSFSADQVAQFPVDIASVANDTCFKEWGGQCSGLTPEFFAAVDLPNLGKLGATCVEKLSNAVFAALTPEKFEQFSLSCAGITATTLEAVPEDVVVSMTSECFQSIPPTACASLPKTIAQWTAEMIGDFTPACWKELPDPSLKALTANQIGALSDEVCQQLTFDVLKLLEESSSLSGITGDCLSIWNSTAICPQLTAEQIAVLAPPAASKLTGNCISLLIPETFAGFTPEQGKTFDHDECVRFSAVQVEKFQIPTFGNLTLACLDAMTAPTCAGFSAAFLETFSQEKVSAMSGACISVLKSSVIASMTVSQILALRPDGFSGLNDAEAVKLLTALGSPLVDGASSDQCNALDSSVFPAIFLAFTNGELVADRAADAPATLTSLQLAFRSAAAMKALTETDVSSIPSLAFKGLRGAQIVQIQEAAFPGFNPGQFPYLAPSTFHALVDSCKASSKVCGGHCFAPHSCVQQLFKVDPEALEAASDMALKTLTVADAAAFCKEQAAAFSAIQLALLPAEAKTAVEAVAASGTPCSGASSSSSSSDTSESSSTSEASSSTSEASSSTSEASSSSDDTSGSSLLDFLKENKVLVLIGICLLACGCALLFTYLCLRRCRGPKRTGGGRSRGPLSPADNEGLLSMVPKRMKYQQI